MLSSKCCQANCRFLDVGATRASHASSPEFWIFGTGGTISCIETGDHRRRPELTVEELLQRLPSRVRHLARLKAIDLWLKDSVDFGPADLSALCAAVLGAIDAGASAIIITAGTDMLEFISSGLAVAFGSVFGYRRLPLPIIVTGALSPGDTRNLCDAIRVADSAIKNSKAEVCVVFGSVCLRGSRVNKVSVRNSDAFSSPCCPPLVSDISTDEPIVFRSSTWERGVQGLHERTWRTPQFRNGVVYLPIVPGISREVLTKLLGTINGLVVGGCSGGNVPSNLVSFFEYAVVRNKPVVVVSKYGDDAASDKTLYEPAYAALAAGAIPGGDMNPTCAVMKLSFLLGSHFSFTDIRHKMVTNFADEIS